LSLNVLGLRNNMKRKSLFRHFKQNKFDIVCIQESHVTQNIIETWKTEWGGEVIYCEGTSHSKGQLILIRKHFPWEWSIEKLASRIIAIKVKRDDKDMCIFNVYAPNSSPDLRDFFKDLTGIINETDIQHKIICGDFNCVLNNELDIISGEPHHKYLVENVNNFVENTGLTDSWRLFNAETKEYSWARKRANAFIARRLDYIFATDSIIDDLIECNMYSLPSSDHRGVYIQIKCHDQKRGPSFWKFNNTLLKEKTFVDRINIIVDTFLIDNFGMSPDIKWELLKLKLKEESIQYSKTIAVKKKNDVISLQNKLNEYDCILAKHPQNKDILRERETMRLKLEIVEREKAQSAQTRARIKWIEEGEKNAKYFLNLEKSKANAKLLPKLEIENRVLTDQFDIIRAQKEYFEKLYNPQPTEVTEENINTFLRNCEIPLLSPRQKSECEGLITVTEATVALKCMKNGSAPGLDGLTT
jgi:exonuclease III